VLYFLYGRRQPHATQHFGPADLTQTGLVGGIHLTLFGVQWRFIATSATFVESGVALAVVA
jgi:hypothetical protein